MKPLAMFFTVAAMGVPACAADADWQRAGPPEQVQVNAESGAISVNADDAVTAGALSAAKAVPSGADAVLVQAAVSGAPQRGATFALQNAADGRTAGYWQNPLAIESEQHLAAVLPLAHGVDRARLFAGTHRQASGAQLQNIAVTPLRSGAAARGSIWAAWVDAKRDQCQTFVADGKLEAVTIRLRHGQPGQTSGGLRVRVYEWTGDIASSRRGSPIGDAVLPAELIPPGEEGDECNVSIAIPAPTKAGNTYLLSFALAQPNQEQGLLLWGGPDNYNDGQRFENDSSKTDWDLYFATYYAAR